MRLVRLSCDCYVNPEDVSGLKVNACSDTITVRMRSGVEHSTHRLHGKTIWETAEALRVKIEGGPATEHRSPPPSSDD